MNYRIVDHIEKIVPLSEDETQQVAACFSALSVKKRQFIVQLNYVARHRNYVLEGAFRAYVITAEGKDQTINFAIDDWWITDYNSYIFQQPASMFVVALEDSKVLQTDFEKEQELKRTSHTFETFFRIIAERGLAFQQRRIIAKLTQSAEQRYELFTAKYFHVVQRIPQYALASYLGMTTEFLSRIRKKRRDGNS